jgi:hypothetical protein
LSFPFSNLWLVICEGLPFSSFDHPILQRQKLLTPSLAPLHIA